MCSYYYLEAAKHDVCDKETYIELNEDNQAIRAMFQDWGTTLEFHCYISESTEFSCKIVETKIKGANFVAKLCW